MRRVKAAVLSSGSAGNCVWVEADGHVVLIDCGLSVPELGRRLSAIGERVEDVAAVFITHDHGDHVGSSVALARKRGVPLYATRGTHSVLRRLPEELARTVRGDDRVDSGPFEIRCITVPHDGIESVAYRVTHRATARSMAVVTDLGYVPRGVVDAVEGVNLLVAEHNHDDRMLIEGPYPAMLKSRIRSPVGHLSNEQGASLVAGVSHAGLTQVVLAHLSETNNTPDAALRTFERVNRDAPSTLNVEVAHQKRPCGPYPV